MYAATKNMAPCVRAKTANGGSESIAAINDSFNMLTKPRIEEVHFICKVYFVDEEHHRKDNKQGIDGHCKTIIEDSLRYRW